MFLLPVMAAAQDEWSAVEADSALSALFSRQFVLPDEHQINAFECIIGDTIVISSPFLREHRRHLVLRCRLAKPAQRVWRKGGYV